MSSQRLSKAVTLASIVVPACAVMVTRSMLPSAGLATAAASTSDGNRSPEKRATIHAPRTPRDLSRVRAEVDLLRDTPVGASPFVSRVPRALTKIVMTTPEAASKPLPEFTLTSVAGGAKQSFAVINGKVQRLGDDLGDGWVVSSIDASAGEVKVAGQDDITLTLTLRKER